MKPTNAIFTKPTHQYCVSQWELPSSLAPHKKKLDPIHGQTSSCFRHKLWFQTKRMLQKLISGNQHINIVYTNKIYQFFLAPCTKKLNSIHGWSSSHFKDKLGFQTKQRLQLLFSRIQCINIRYPKENYPFFLASSETHEKKLDSIHGWSLSRFKDKLWFQTKRRL